MVELKSKEKKKKESLRKLESIRAIESGFIKKDLPKLRIGDNVKIGVEIVEFDKDGNLIKAKKKKERDRHKKKITEDEEEKKRIQFYEGTIIAKKNTSVNTTITVRKTFQGVGVERIFLIHSPRLDSIQVLRSSKVRRSKLYYLRNLKGKATRLQQTFE